MGSYGATPNHKNIHKLNKTASWKWMEQAMTKELSEVSSPILNKCLEEGNPAW